MNPIRQRAGRHVPVRHVPVGHGRVRHARVRRACVALVIAGGATWCSPGDASAAPVVLTAPVSGPVVASADPPEDPYAPGRRAAIVRSVPAGAVVLAPADGTVRWHGSVAGTRYVVVDHGDGVVTTVGRVRGPFPPVRTAVRRGAPIATHDPTADPVGVTFSVRRHGLYVDPAPLMRGVRARLVNPPGCLEAGHC